MKPTEVLASVHEELCEAQSAHRPMASHHEAYAVILEELDEYWDEVKEREPDAAARRRELTQVAAMAVRALVDLD